MKNILLALIFGSLMIVMACGDGNVTITEDPAIQAAEDSTIIVNYLSDLGFEGDAVGVLETGVRYVILDSGNLESIDESDIVSYDFVGKLTNDTIFDTTIEAVADSIRTKVAEDTVGKDDITEQLFFLGSFPEDGIYTPVIFTYSSAGWTLESAIDGFRDGVAATFQKVSEGASILIVIPSGEAYGNDLTPPRRPTILIPENAVLVFELYPVEVIKQ